MAIPKKRSLDPGTLNDLSNVNGAFQASFGSTKIEDLGLRVSYVFLEFLVKRLQIEATEIGSYHQNLT